MLTFCHSAKTVLEKAKFCWQNVHSKIAYSAINSASRIYPKYYFNSFLFRWQDSHNQAWFMNLSGVRWLGFRRDMLFFLLVTLVLFEQLRIESELRKVCTLCAPLFFSEVDYEKSPIVGRAKRERAWKSLHARKGDTRRGERKIFLSLHRVAFRSLYYLWGKMGDYYNLEPRVRFSFGHRGQSCWAKKGL